MQSIRFKGEYDNGLLFPDRVSIDGDHLCVGRKKAPLKKVHTADVIRLLNDKIADLKIWSEIKIQDTEDPDFWPNMEMNEGFGWRPIGKDYKPFILGRRPDTDGQIFLFEKPVAKIGYAFSNTILVTCDIPSVHVSYVSKDMVPPSSPLAKLLAQCSILRRSDCGHEGAIKAITEALNTFLSKAAGADRTAALPKVSVARTLAQKRPRDPGRSTAAAGTAALPKPPSSKRPHTQALEACGKPEVRAMSRDEKLTLYAEQCRQAAFNDSPSSKPGEVVGVTPAEARDARLFSLMRSPSGVREAGFDGVGAFDI